MWTKRAAQCTIFHTVMCCNESSPNSSCNFGSHRVRVSSNVASMFSLWKIALLYFFGLHLLCFLQNYPIKIQIFKLSTARVKSHQIPNLVVQIKSQYFFKVLITLQCNERWFFRSFLAGTLYAIDKRNTSKCKF